MILLRKNERRISVEVVSLNSTYELNADQVKRLVNANGEVIANLADNRRLAVFRDAEPKVFMIKRLGIDEAQSTSADVASQRAKRFATRSKINVQGLNAEGNGTGISFLASPFGGRI